MFAKFKKQLLISPYKSMVRACLECYSSFKGFKRAGSDGASVEQCAYHSDTLFPGAV